jgi:hypothetical protein
MTDRAGGVAVDASERSVGDDAVLDAADVDPSEAFAPLGNEHRVRVLAALLSGESEDGGLAPTTRTFSELYEASGVETTAGFAYHLRQLTDHYLREVEEGYAFTDAGLRIARAIVSGAYTDSVDRDPVSVDDPCPFCGETALEADADDNTVTVVCRACERDVLSLSFPPGGHHTHDDASLPAALDRLHRHRVALMTRGSCPECGGASRARVEYAADVEVGIDVDVDVDRSAERVDENEMVDESETTGGDDDSVHLALDCVACGYALRCPVTFAVLDHPAVVSLYHDHGIDVRDRPLWNVGSEWTEDVLSSDPWCVRVATDLDGDGLELFVGGDGRVVGTDRFDVDVEAGS